jgi:translation initiation factor IF-2
LATVRIYKVAELLNTTSQEVLHLLKQNHGIELKSASSTLEEIVARQFVERLARQRGIELPKGDIFSDAAVKSVKKSGSAGKKGAAAAEPVKPAAPALPPPRLIKTARPPAPPTAPVNLEHEVPAPAAEAAPPPLDHPTAVTSAAPPPPVVEHAPEPTVVAEAPAPPVAEEPTLPPAPVEEPLEAPAAAASAEQMEPEPGPAKPTPAPGRFVPPSIRLRVEEPGQAPPKAPPLQPRRPLAPPPPRVVQPPPARPAASPSSARPGGAGAPRQYQGRPAAGTTPAMIGGPRPLPAQPVRPTNQPGRPGQQQYPRPGGMPQRPGGQYQRPGGYQQRPQHSRPSGHRREAPRPTAPPPVELPPVSRTITLAEGMTVKDLSDKLDVRVKDVLKALLDRRLMMTINSTIDIETARDVARQFGADIQTRSFEEELIQDEAETIDAADLIPRAPVVTVMGHVDHGKTTLLDSIRSARVADREAGGITQHIGAYLVTVGEKNDKPIVFLDTPGHEAFTLMRARGSRVTDVVILVVAADDGVMPQTKEAIDHARAANVPIIVAVNKVDKPGANAEVVKRQLADLNLVPEEWGGNTVFVEVSAKKKTGLELLLEMILLVTEIAEHKANPKRAAVGTVLETKLDRGRGPVATVLVQDGSLRVGDNIIAGPVVGRVRALIDDRGRPLKVAGPSTPVEVLGLEQLPSPGDSFQMVSDPAKARQIATFRQTQAKERALGAKGGRLTLESLQAELAKGDVKELPIIIKADVQGSAEVLASTLSKLSDDKTKIKIIHTAVGAINESDVLLAAASNAIIIGFNVRPDRNAADVAERETVDIRHHSVIYNVTDEIKKAMTGLLQPTFKEQRLGSAVVRETFKVPKVGTIAGCMVQDGRITRSGDAQARLLRDHVVVWEGRLASLRRFKDDVSEVKAGFECGIGLANFNDLKVGDVIEVFQMQQVAATA